MTNESPSYRIEPIPEVGLPYLEAVAGKLALERLADDCYLVRDTRLQAIIGAREAATTEVIEWFANAGLMSDFDEVTAMDIETLMGNVYAILGIEDALNEENKT